MKRRNRVPRPKRIVEERKENEWRRLYAGQVRLKNRLKPAYNNAIAPALAGVIDHLKRSQIRVLVIAGGTGVFSRDLLPEVKNLLRSRKINVEIKVVETDLTNMIQGAPNNAHRARADFHRLPFANESFDLIVGQSMLHHGRTGESIPEIKRVMSEGGVFFHVQDSIPNIDKIIPGIRRNPQMPLQEDLQKRMVTSASVIAHQALLESVERAAENCGLDSHAFVIEGRAVIPRSYKLGKFGGIDLDKNPGNFVEYNFGGIGVTNDSSVPKGKRMLGYTGLVTVLAKTSTTRIIEHLAKFMA